MANKFLATVLCCISFSTYSVAAMRTSSMVTSQISSSQCRISRLAASKIVPNRQELRMWLAQEITPGFLLRVGNDGFVKRAALSTNRMAMCLDNAYRVFCYNPANGELIWFHDLNGEQGLPVSVAMNADGSRVAVIQKGDPELRTSEQMTSQPTGILLDGLTGNEISRLPSDTKNARELLCAQFSHDGTEIVSGSNLSTIALWDAKTGVSKGDISVHDHRVECVQYNEADDLLVSGGDDMLVCLIKKEPLEKIQEYKGHQAAVRTVSFSADGSKIISGDCKKRVCIWDIATGACLRTLKHRFAVEHAELSPDGNSLAVTDGERVTAIWDLRQAQVVDQFVMREMKHDQYLLLEDIRRSCSKGRLCQLDAHVLKDAWKGLPADVVAAVARHTKTEDCNE